jgi:hypothetical protein
MRGDVGRALRRAFLQIPPRSAEAQVAEQVFEQQRQRAAVLVPARDARRLAAGKRVQIRRDELDFGGNADRAEQPARDRAEEGLAELFVCEAGDLIREQRADRDPEFAVQRPLAEPQLQFGDRDVDPAVIEVDALDGIALAAFPVARLEALRGAARDRAEVGVIAGERLGQVPCALCDEVVRRVQIRLRSRRIRDCGSARPRTRCT